MADLAERFLDHLKVGMWPESGYNVYLPPDIHRQPIYSLGVSGSGKSTLIGNLAMQWSRMGEGVLLIDVKDGQLARDVAARATWDKLVYVAPGTTIFDDHPHHWGLNILELRDRHRPTISQVVDNVMSMLERLDRADYTQMTLLRTQQDSAVRPVLYEPEPNLIKVRQALTEHDYRAHLMARHADVLNSEVADHFARLDDPKQNSPFGRSQQINSTVNRLKELITPPELRNMLIQPHSTMRLADWLEAGKLVVVDCVSGPPGELVMSNRNAELLGNLVSTQAMHFTFTRVVAPESRPVRLICDEFDLLAGNNFARLITKARSYKVFPVMAHQNKDQLKADRDRAQTLFNAASGVPVEFEFTLTDQDRAQMNRLRPHEEQEELEAFTARLHLRRKGLPMGLLDANKIALIRLSDWWEPVIPGQYERAVAAQERMTTPERVLRRTTMEATDHDHARTQTPSRPNSPQPRAGRQAGAKPRDDSRTSQSPGDAGDAGEVPDPAAWQLAKLFYLDRSSSEDRTVKSVAAAQTTARRALDGRCCSCALTVWWCLKSWATTTANARAS